MKTHKGEKPFKCERCSSAFAQKSHFTNHMRQHTDEKPFQCPLCPSAILEKHVMGQKGEKSHKFSVRNSAFATKDDLIDHLKKKHGAKE